MLTPFEKVEAAECDKLILQCGGEIVNFSQPFRAAQTAGISDRRYRCFGVAFWFEVKSQDKEAQLTADQYDFLTAEFYANSPGACGTLADLTLYLPEVRKGRALSAGRIIVDRWKQRGFRRTSKKRRAG